jgi:hypothetical protein
MARWWPRAKAQPWPVPHAAWAWGQRITHKNTHTDTQTHTLTHTQPIKPQPPTMSNGTVVETDESEGGELMFSWKPQQCPIHQDLLIGQNNQTRFDCKMVGPPILGSDINVQAFDQPSHHTQATFLVIQTTVRQLLLANTFQVLLHLSIAKV